MSEVSTKHPRSHSEGDHESSGAVPLSTRNIAGIVLFLAVYSFVYLFYAQFHKLLFCLLTGLIVLWISFVYTAGILAVIYMVRADYRIDECDRARKLNESSI